MKNRPVLQNVLFTLIALSPLLVMLAIWNTIPAEIPFRAQYGFRDDGVGLSPKENLWGSVPVICAVTIVLYFLLSYIKRVDPKRAAKDNTDNGFKRIAVGFTLLLTTLNFIMLLDSIGKLHNGKDIMMPMLGVLFAFLGNVMHNVKPNYFVGIRIPWTLNSDYNWRKTHQLAGKLWFAGGLLFTISYFIYPHVWNDASFLAFIIVLVGVPVAYSFIIYRKELSNAR